METKRTPEHVVRRIAVEAMSSPKTVRRLLDGKPVRAMGAERIMLAMDKLGFKKPTFVVVVQINEVST